jgi:hypothetical protein
MAKNRRRVDGEVTFAWVAARLLLFTLLVSFLLGITFLKRRNLQLGDELRKVDRDLKVALEKTSSMELQLARYKTPHELEAKNIKWKIGMVRPNEDQIHRVAEPGVLSAVRKAKSSMVAAQVNRLSTEFSNP